MERTVINFRKLSFHPVKRGGPDGGARSKHTPRTGLSISDEMVPSIVAEDGIVLRVYCLLAEA